MAIEHRVNSAAGRNLNLTRKAAQQAFVDLASTPVRLLSLEVDDGGLDLLGQLVAVTPGPPRTVRQGLQPRLFVAVKNLVAGLARDRLWHRSGTNRWRPSSATPPKSNSKSWRRSKRPTLRLRSSQLLVTRFPSPRLCG